jgi:hypothetical protein
MCEENMARVQFSMVRPKGDRIHFVNQEDVEIVLGRLPVELWQRLRHVHFNDRGLGGRRLGYVTVRGRREITLCALPPRVSLNGCCRLERQSPLWFGAGWGRQWPVLAVRRFLLYEVFLHELGHLQVYDLRRPSDRLRFYDEKLAQEFANSWRQQLWSAHFDHPDPVHNPPRAEELLIERAGVQSDSRALTPIAGST